MNQATCTCLTASVAAETTHSTRITKYLARWVKSARVALSALKNPPSQPAGTLDRVLKYVRLVIGSTASRHLHSRDFSRYREPFARLQLSHFGTPRDE